jgi:integrase
MSRRHGTYITRTKHGVYYFQLRVSKFEANLLGVRSRLFRKSLGTKDKWEAISKARRFWVQLEKKLLRGRTMPIKSSEQSMEDFLREQDEIEEHRMQRSRFIRAALDFTDRLEAIPDWDEMGREILFDSRTQLEIMAMQWVADDEIDLNSYRTPELPQTPQAYIDYRRAHLKGEYVSILMDKWMADKEAEKPKSNKVKKDLTNRIKLFIEIVGDIKSDELSHDEIDRYKQILPKLPPNRKKKKETRNLSLDEIVKKDWDQKLAPKTLETYVDTLKGFLRWCVDRDYVVNNISVPLRGFCTNAESYSYLPFTHEDLQSMFCSKYYLKGAWKADSEFWVPLIGLLTGARLEEICQLRYTDIDNDKQFADFHYFEFTPLAKKSQLKSSSSQRAIPVHPVLIDLGLLDLISLKSESDPMLFSDLRERDGRYSDDFSDWFNRTFFKNVGIKVEYPHKRKSFHSFRDVIGDKIEGLGYSERVVGHWLGHKETTMAGKHYLSKTDLATKWEILNKIEFGIDFKELRRWIPRK